MPTSRGRVPSAVPTLPMTAFVVVLSVSEAATIAPPIRVPSPFLAPTVDVSVWVALTESRSTRLPAGATAPSPTAASIAMLDVADAALSPPPINAPSPPACTTSNVVPPDAEIDTVAGRVAPVPTVAFTLPPDVAVLSLTCTPTPPTSTANEEAVMVGLPWASRASLATPLRSTPSPIDASRTTLLSAVARTRPTVIRPPLPPSDLAVTLPNEFSCVPPTSTLRPPLAALTLAPAATVAVTIVVSFEAAWPLVPPPPIASASDVATLRVESTLPERAATATSPVRAVTAAAPIRAVTVSATVASAVDQPVEPPTTESTPAPTPTVLVMVWPVLAATLTSAPLTVPPPISVVIALIDETLAPA